MTRSTVLRSVGVVGLLLGAGCAQTISHGPPARETVLEERRLRSVLVCSPDLSDEQDISPGQARHLRTVSHEVRITGGGGPNATRVRLGLASRDTVSVRLEGDTSLTFSPLARLDMSIAHCTEAQKGQELYIWRRGEGNAPDQKLATQRIGQDILRTWISHASVFMIAN